MNCAKCNVSVNDKILYRINPKGVDGIWWCDVCIREFEPTVYQEKVKDEQTQLLKDLKEILYPF